MLNVSSQFIEWIITLTHDVILEGMLISGHAFFSVPNCAMEIWGSYDWPVDLLTCLNKYTHRIWSYYLAYNIPHLYLIICAPSKMRPYRSAPTRTCCKDERSNSDVHQPESECFCFCKSSWKNLEIDGQDTDGRHQEHAGPVVGDERQLDLGSKC